MIPENAQILPIRYCAGGCSHPSHHAHAYSVDPADGKLRREFLCPGNLGEAKEIINEHGQSSLYGFIAEAQEVAQ